MGCRTKFLKINVDEDELEREETSLEIEAGWLHDSIEMLSVIELKEGEELILKRKNGNMETIAFFEDEYASLSEEVINEITYYAKEIRDVGEAEAAHIISSLKEDCLEIGKLVSDEDKKVAQMILLRRLVAEG